MTPFTIMLFVVIFAANTVYYLVQDLRAEKKKKSVSEV
ncbi:hypothetical protein SAMN05444955_11768 [Lihuaxuella thermophila]|uniref:Uncharacterized protein n=1 Tax=Lihuaxuella thermophila TaxID=1173111 RepID=A0A1H8IF98_9BACL|nr:hypothetical protein SAMN05444955_11768 [Lihuaxuella thermophila]